jgi:hypothetical protein
MIKTGRAGHRFVTGGSWLIELFDNVLLIAVNA